MYIEYVGKDLTFLEDRGLIHVVNDGMLIGVVFQQHDEQEYRHQITQWHTLVWTMRNHPHTPFPISSSFRDLNVLKKHVQDEIDKFYATTIGKYFYFPIVDERIQITGPYYVDLPRPGQERCVVRYEDLPESQRYRGFLSVRCSIIRRGIEFDDYIGQTLWQVRNVTGMGLHYSFDWEETKHFLAKVVTGEISEPKVEAALPKGVTEKEREEAELALW